MPTLCSAKLRRALYKGFEDRLQVEGRPADGLEDVGGRGLLLQGFTQLVQQTRILDRDDGLRGEVLEQFDLLVSKRPDLLSINCYRTDDLIFFHHRNPNQGSRARKVDGGFAQLVPMRRKR